MDESDQLPLGASFSEGVWWFNVWAPKAESLELVIENTSATFPMTRNARGYHVAKFLPATHMTTIRYFYRFPDGRLRPDPASSFQPDGVHGPSEAGGRAWNWSDAEWRGLPVREYIIYELHVGTFTQGGTLQSAIAELPRLKALGITAIELMPLAQFPGERNWGYDGVGFYAAQNSYGGSEGLMEFVDAAHRHGLAVILDVVYNHAGPEGNYLNEFGHYFTDAYKTPWGGAINYDRAHSHHVRRFFIENALRWQREFHIDALRLDAVHAIYDQSARPFLREVAEAVAKQAEQLGRPFHLIAESDLNTARFVLPTTLGGYGMTAQWADDFHHCLHVLLTKEKCGYYSAYTGGVEQFAKVWRHGFAYTGEISPFSNAPRGEPADLLGYRQFVVCAQNHDQVGNRMLGERLSSLVDLERLKLAASVVLFSPFTPLLFMGEEYGETAPFQYFASHTDEALIDAVRIGRKNEFPEFFEAGPAPDPFALETFIQCKVKPELRHEGSHAMLYSFYKAAIVLSKTHSCFSRAERHQIDVSNDGNILTVSYRYPPDSVIVVVFNFSHEPVPAPFSVQKLQRVFSSTKAPFLIAAQRQAASFDNFLNPWSANVWTSKV